MKIIPVPVREDNYAYLLIDEPSKKAAAVDPYDVSKVVDAAKEHNVELVAAITTHHHHDHSGGNQAFSSRYPNGPIYGGSEKVAAVKNIVKDKDEFTLGDNVSIKCLATPCHTQDSICYYVTDKTKSGHPGGIFTGDTLFIAGCGRFFEGTGDEMNKALSYIGTLPNETVVYNGHEYTASNLKFAKSVDPDNQAFQKLDKIIHENKITTGLTTIGDEKEWNVFMRLDTEAVRKATISDQDTPQNIVMDALRDKKNNFRG